MIFAAAFILYGLIHGLDDAQRVLPPSWTRALAAIGVLIFAGVGLASILMGGEFLDYDVLRHDPHHGQHLGILLVELGVLVTVFRRHGDDLLRLRRPRPHAGRMKLLGLYNYWVFIFLMMVGFYAIISRGNLIKKVVGLGVFQTSVFIFYISLGKVRDGTPPILLEDGARYSNPLPHVLILTAIVVGVATTALALALVVRIQEAYGTVEEDEIHRRDVET